MPSPASNDYDVIVVGGGHAGTEAALASARMGRRTLLLTHNLDTVGQMSCNPSIGGIGKGHLVKEVDALGGAMAEAADEAGIHFRILNRSKGPAVRATRAQADRVLYRAAIRRHVEQQPNLSVFQAACDDLLLTGSTVTGVVTETDLRFTARAVVLTAGTFLNGRIHVGLAQRTGGRAGDPASQALAARLRELKLPQGRLKTGTPPRLDGRTIDFTRLERQDGDGVGPEGGAMPVFGFLGEPALHPEQRPCWITHTNAATHNIVRSGLDRSPMFTGVIEGVGPRYCPSIEDKIHRFAHRDSHQVFLEPEGLSTHEYYPNGISTSLPYDVQLATVRSIAGLEQAHIVRPGYAIEYDYFDPRSLKRSFETRDIAGLFFAGQINGTTGYEEAAAQGLHAGVNAALHARGSSPWTPGRHEAYIGVMVDDLVSKGVTEPYRMFTSRAEYRLQLREDNADLRLTEIGRQLGLVDDRRWARLDAKRSAITTGVAALESHYLQPALIDPATAIASFGATIDHEYSYAALLRRPGVALGTLLPWMPEDVAVDVSRETLSQRLGETAAAQVVEQIETSVKYAGYVAKQQSDVARTATLDQLPIPADLDYADVPALGYEARQVLNRARPLTLGAAAALSGVTPATLSLLVVHLHRHRRSSSAVPAAA